jgi:hypothetical protein
MVGMSRLYLINDDEPSTFVPRVATIVRAAVRVGNREGVFVVIKPPIENSAGNPLAAAILIPDTGTSRLTICVVVRCASNLRRIGSGPLHVK